MTINVKEKVFVNVIHDNMFENILVPYDLSDQSTSAFKTALSIAKKYDSKVTLLTCLEGDTWHHYYYDSRADKELIKKQNKIVKPHLQKLEKIAEKNKIPVKSYVLTSKSVINDIVTFAKSRKYDLIVIGSHGRTGFDKFLLGSVANGVSQKTKSHILIVK